jgi:hypothetical protein
MNAERLRQLKLLLSATFLAAATCFVFPFLAIAIDERLGRGNGVELAAGNADVSGRYVHDAYVGQVEEGIDLAQLPAAVAFVAMLVGALGTWLPKRKGFWLGLGAGAVGLLGLVWLRQALSGPQLLAEVELQYGYWLSTVGVLGVAALAAFILYRTSWTYLNR